MYIILPFFIDPHVQIFLLAQLGLGVQFDLGNRWVQGDLGHQDVHPLHHHPKKKRNVLSICNIPRHRS